MESYNSSPNYIRGTSSFDAKKESSPQGGSECDDSISVSSSTCGSAIRNNGIKNRTNGKKLLKSSGNVKSFRRRAKSRITRSPATMSDDSLVESSGSSPHYLKATSCSEGKKMHSESSQSKLASPSHRSWQTLSRTSSFRNVGFLIKKTSFKPRRLSYAKVSEDVSVDRATHSSTLKDTKFPVAVEIQNGEIEPKKISALKICRYHHCSLHGHCHGGHDPSPPPKRFLYKRRQSMKKQRSFMPKTESKAKIFSDKNKNLHNSQVVPVVEALHQGGLSNKNTVHSYEGIYAEPEAQLFGDGYDNIQESDIIEVAFGETSFPERSYEENLNILRKYSSQEQGYCFRCSCHKTEQAMVAPGRADVDSPPLKVDSTGVDSDCNNEICQNGNTDVSEMSTSVRFKNPEERVSTNVEDSGTLISTDKASNKSCLETPAVFDEVTKQNSVFSTASQSQTSSDNNSEEEGNVTTESTPAGDSEVNKGILVKDTEANSRVQVRFSKRRHISMWHLIHQHMSSKSAAESNKEPLQVPDGENPVNANSTLAKESSTSSRDLLDSEIGTGNNDSENQEIEIRKLFAIKLVREAIEKILLPEVQSDDQSVTSESAPQPEPVERNQSEACTQENQTESEANKEEGNVSSHPKEESLITDEASGPKIKETEEKVVRKSEKKAPKHWSNLKKWILLQRFIRELEKVKKFNPRKPQLLPLNPHPEAERVNLRHQTADERRNAEEWMLDFALRQAVNQLAPTQKKKVSLLVKAFETVVPPQDEPQVQFRIPRLEDNSTYFSGNKEEAPVNGKAVQASDDGVSILESEKQENVIELTKETESLLVLNDYPSESSASKEENARECSGDQVELQGIHKDSNVSVKSEYLDGVLIPTNGNINPEDRDVGNEEQSLANLSLTIDGNGKSVATEDTLGGASHPDEAEREARPMMQGPQEDAIADCPSGNMKNSGQDIQMDRKNHIRMWHMIYQHVVSGIAEKVGRQLLEGSEDDDHVSSGFTKSDVLKLIKEAVDEILIPEIQDDNSSDTQSVTSESISDQYISERNSVDEDAEAESQVNKKFELPKAKNWSKLKKVILLRRSIRALEKAREFKPQPRTLLPQTSDPEPEKVDLRSQMMDERKKAEQWMLDYAVQHIVTKLTPTRKRRVSMLVEAFEAVVPLPEM